MWRQPASRTIAGLLPPLALGCALRLFRVDDQLLVWDEMHTVHGALEMPLREILRTWTHDGGDYCVPLTAFYHLLMGEGVALSETGFRVPVLVAGIAALVVIPLALVPRIGARAANVLAWLLAISPVLVLYSRIVRSYMPIVLLGFGAVMAFDRWWRTRARGAGAAWAALAAVSVWFHLGAATFVFAPLVYALAAGALGRRGRATWLALAGWLALALGVVAALLLPARESLLALLDTNRGGRPPAAATWLEVARMWAGTGSAPWAALVWLAAARGARELWRRDRAFLLYVATLALVHVAGLALLAPVMWDRVLVANRYVVVLLPFFLALVALGLATPWAARAGAPDRWQRVQTPALAVLVVALLLAGPLAGDDFRRSQFVHHPRFMKFTQPRTWPADEEIPSFYRELRARPAADETLVEYPWLNRGSRGLWAYQRVHGRRVLGAPPGQVLFDGRLALRHLVAATPEALLASGARWLVVHRDFESESARFAAVLSEPGERGRREFWGGSRRRAEALAAELRAAWGPPAQEDEALAVSVWDLDAVRAARP